jgi:hypothetical protein
LRRAVERSRRLQLRRPPVTAAAQPGPIWASWGTSAHGCIDSRRTTGLRCSSQESWRRPGWLAVWPSPRVVWGLAGL